MLINMLSLISGIIMLNILVILAKILFICQSKQFLCPETLKICDEFTNKNKKSRQKIKLDVKYKIKICGVSS